MQTRSTLKWYLLILVAGAMSCRAVRFYNDPSRPFYYASQKDSSAQAAGADSLNIVTFNIKKAEKIDLAIAELRRFGQQKPIDIYLLQEMNEQGVEAIAAALGLNYLYIPIVHDNADHKNIGNAILSKGAIEKPEKLILPHAKWQNQQRRDVTIGEVTIHEKKILVYSVHTETFSMKRSKRMDQIDTIISHARMQCPEYDYVLIGGDFNTIFPKDGNRVVEKFSGGGFEWATSKVGSTARAMMGMVKPRHDYVFSKGLKLANAYKIETSRSSDHYPVFATFHYGDRTTLTARKSE
ncbi:endonuclease/exonuclease/phosphatase family protein [Sediminibacterium soli]|uniref:endonuclease/exonuclease/phosphatase family protein n=1 Tax=Sediminibacterium soli TaxID=2698829 RepID=UPI00137A3214|nr:endonuclease/exonuclease/phosphatase family protein [Sediminibacterium soli]NCI45186.1 hypothetical protein [Sediminibacterium soli]